MLKFIKGNLENIDNVQIYPMISLLIFFFFFVALFYWVITAKKDHITEVSNIPLEDDTKYQNDEIL
ncbi:MULTISPECIES: CcoQ/FixQ family Cbb3-type cytochrome c oxidase assembly chaperone [Aequorivita]|jgi:cbb3-type cytochrome oxidase subunit 3|uniref:CcoQ/FixQ family Cbb3-type cytochrome c oxidase assembly chaperone n=2 Tax=Aequorivita TaxID=153265 RepID=A0AB35YSU3_9FLAO|nr:CcoQ/FixQ family Cbb3-type cytochrome c oxidase assembly chaperone [Aequorivita sp. Ant34-E75]WGF91647.1 CcoQ/FixQ family Cbb3-type cytochrome c oxidase assembly chaperone [Aequorivita sp. Ant34-E75]